MSDIPAGLEQALAGRYRIDGILGQGGMATVFKAHDLRHERGILQWLDETLGPVRRK